MQAGQFEQAVEDGGRLDPAPARAATDAAARAFVEGGGPGPPFPGWTGTEDPPLEARTPEGFAWHALSPEAYVAAADAWIGAARPAPHAEILVVGLRSVGTTLSALVLAALRRRGLRASRITVRPSGHPFARTLEPLPTGAGHVLLVDEGPGLSGSSLGAAVRAARAAGVPPERVALLPGHGGDPGPRSSREVRALWRETARHVAPSPDPEALAATLPGEPAAIEGIGDGGRFERPKLRVTLASGRRYLLRYAGLAAAPGGRSTGEQAFERLHRLAAHGWGPHPLSLLRGWIVLPWLPGRPATPEEARARLLPHALRYLERTAGPPLDDAESARARERLRSILRARGRDDRVPDLPPGVPSCADADLAPQEWIVLPGGAVLKVDAADHLSEPTAAGRQPLPWAYAALAETWGLPRDADLPYRDVLPAYRRAWRALREGIAELG